MCVCDAGSKGCDCVLQVFYGLLLAPLEARHSRRPARAHTYTSTSTSHADFCVGKRGTQIGKQIHGCPVQPARHAQVDPNQPDGAVGSGGALGRQKKTGGGNRDRWGPRRRMGNSMVRLPFLPCQSRCRFSLFVTLLLAWPLAWPVLAPHGHSVFSTVSPHARPDRLPNRFCVCFSLTATNVLMLSVMLLLMSSKTSPSLFLFVSCLQPALLPACSSRPDGTSDQCDLCAWTQRPAGRRERRLCVWPTM